MRGTSASLFDLTESTSESPANSQITSVPVQPVCMPAALVIRTPTIFNTVKYLQALIDTGRQNVWQAWSQLPDAESSPK